MDKTFIKYLHNAEPDEKKIQLNLKGKKKKTVLHTSHTQCWDPNKLVKFSSLEGRRER